MPPVRAQQPQESRPRFAISPRERAAARHRPRARAAGLRECGALSDYRVPAPPTGPAPDEISLISRLPPTASRGRSVAVSMNPRGPEPAVQLSERAQPSFALGSTEGTPGTALCKGLTSSDAFVNAWAERSCSQLCSQTADFADVRGCSSVSKSLVALRIRSLANGGEHAAQDWGSRGRRFKSCHPDGKQQVRGRFGEIRGGLFAAV